MSSLHILQWAVREGIVNEHEPFNVSIARHLRRLASEEEDPVL